MAHHSKGYKDIFNAGVRFEIRVISDNYVELVHEGNVLYTSVYTLTLPAAVDVVFHGEDADLKDIKWIGTSEFKQPNSATICTAVGFGGLLRYAEAVPSTHGLKHTHPTTSLQGGASSVLQIPDSSSMRGVTFKAVQNDKALTWLATQLNTVLAKLTV